MPESVYHLGAEVFPVSPEGETELIGVNVQLPEGVDTEQYRLLPEDPATKLHVSRIASFTIDRRSGKVKSYQQIGHLSSQGEKIWFSGKVQPVTDIHATFEPPLTEKGMEEGIAYKLTLIKTS